MTAKCQQDYKNHGSMGFTVAFYFRFYHSLSALSCSFDEEEMQHNNYEQKTQAEYYNGGDAEFGMQNVWPDVMSNYNEAEELDKKPTTNNKPFAIQFYV